MDTPPICGGGSSAPEVRNAEKAYCIVCHFVLAFWQLFVVLIMLHVLLQKYKIRFLSNTLVLNRKLLPFRIGTSGYQIETSFKTLYTSYDN